MTAREAEGTYRAGYRLVFTRGDRQRALVDWKAAADLFEAAARAGHGPAAYRYGRCYDTGNGRRRNHRHALTWYRRAAAAYEPRAAYELARAYRDGDGVGVDPDAAFAWLAFGARVGDAECASDLGYAYHEGRGTPVDVRSAARWYQVAADAGLPRAKFNLALCYVHGNGVPADAARAHALLAEASRDGHEQAATVMERARELAAQARNDDSQRIESGRDHYEAALDETMRGGDERTVAALLRRAVDLGSLDGAYSLGTWYLHGGGVRRNPAEARALLTRAAVPSRPLHTCAYAALAVCYRHGEGGPPDQAASFANALRAALRGDRNAAYGDACAYFLGDGTREDRASALAWFERVDELDAERALHDPECTHADTCRACADDIEQSRRRIHARAGG